MAETIYLQMCSDQPHTDQFCYAEVIEINGLI